MKRFSLKKLMTEGRWNQLTVLFVSLSCIVFLVYAVIFAYPKMLPARLQVRTPTSVPMQPTLSALSSTQPFPTFPPEWTAVFATRHAQSPSLTPTALGSSSGLAASPTFSPTLTLTASLTATPVATVSSPAAPEATLTLTPAGLTPLPSSAAPSPTESLVTNPTAYPGQDEVWTPTPFPPDYPFNP